MTQRIAVIALALAACVAAIPSRSDDYPSRPVRIVFGFGPGSSGDVMSRVLAQRMSQDLGQPFIVEGKPGANGQLGATQVARAPNDGYTLFLASVSNATNVAITPASATDLAKELTPIALVATVPSILVVHPSLGVANVPELIALAKAKPGELTYATSGVGSPEHFAGEMFKMMTKTNLLPVPYKGGGPIAIDLMAGHVITSFSTMPPIIPHIRAGRVKALAVTTDKRAAVLPEVPTIAETVPGYAMSTWYGAVVPAKTPREIVAKLSQEMLKALAAPDVRERLASLGADIVASSPEETAAIFRADIANFTKVAKAANIHAD